MTDKSDDELKSMADCMITCKDEDFIALASGTGNPQQVTFKTTILFFLFISE